MAGTKDGIAHDVSALRAHVMRQLVRERLRQSKTQQDIALCMNIDRSTVGQMEHGTDILLSTLMRYAEALGVRIEIIMIMPEDV